MAPPQQPTSRAEHERLLATAREEIDTARRAKPTQAVRLARQVLARWQAAASAPVPVPAPLKDLWRNARAAAGRILDAHDPGGPHAPDEEAVAAVKARAAAAGAGLDDVLTAIEALRGRQRTVAHADMAAWLERLTELCGDPRAVAPSRLGEAVAILRRERLPRAASERLYELLTSRPDAGRDRYCLTTRAAVLGDLGRIDEGIEVARQAKERFPGDTYVVTTLAALERQHAG